MSKFSQKVARPARTAGQGSVAYAIVETLDAFGADFTTRQYGALVLLLTITLGFLQVLIEDHLGIALMRKMPPTAVKAVEVEPELVDNGPEETDNRPRTEDGVQLPPHLNGGSDDWTDQEMR